MNSDGAMKPFAGFQFSYVYILESLPTGEMHTGRQLANKLEKLLGLAGAVRYSEVRSSQELKAKMVEIADDLMNTGEIPLVHLECHGRLAGDGIVLSSGEFLRWADLREPLSRINVGCGLHLLLVLGVCSGARILELVDATERAPIWGCVGPSKIVLAGEIQDGFAPFYATLFATSDLARALEEGRKRGLAVDAFPVERLFIKAYQIYLRDYFEPRTLWKRANAIGRAVNAPMNWIRRTLRRTREPFFERDRQHFFMTDLFPANSDRFQVSFADVEAPPRQDDPGSIPA